MRVHRQPVSLTQLEQRPIIRLQSLTHKAHLDSGSMPGKVVGGQTRKGSLQPRRALPLEQAPTRKCTAHYMKQTVTNKGYQDINTNIQALSCREHMMRRRLMNGGRPLHR